MNLGIIILCPEANYGTLKFTCNCIKAELNCSFIAITKDKVFEEDLFDLKKYSPTFRGGNSTTSMINEGMKRLNTDWKLVVTSSSNVKYSLWKKYQKFLKEEKDILYPVIHKKWKFYDISLNGLLIHKKAFTDIGDFPNEEPLLTWASNAIDKNYQFKAIVGARL